MVLAVFQKFDALVKLMAPAIDQAVALETQWAKALIKMGKLAWLTQQEASVKSTMNKDALAVVIHAQTYEKYKIGMSENEAHWMWKDSVLNDLSLGTFTATKFADFFADIIAITCIPVTVAKEMGFAMDPIWTRATTVLEKLLGLMAADAANLMTKLKPVTTKFAPAVPAPEATEWDVEGLRELLTADDVEDACQLLHQGSFD